MDGMVVSHIPVLGSVRTELGASWRRSKSRSTLPATDHFDGATFRNIEPSTIMAPASMPSIAKAMLTRGPVGKPNSEVPLGAPSFPGPIADLAVTWLGHASALIEVDGVRVLADPVWSDRVSPSQLVGPRRMHPVPIAFDELPPIDVVIISHDHYDHLDLRTIQLLRDRHRATFVVPLGVDEHLRGWGVPDERIAALDWNERYEHGELSVVSVAARHFSGRSFTRNDTLWSSWALLGPEHRVFFGGDTGYTDTFSEAGAELGPFDLTLLPIGAYDERWPDIHLNPEEAARTHLDLRGAVLLPIHWGTFDLAFHPWVEPVHRLLAAAGEHDITVVIPRPGQRLEDLASGTDAWWDGV
jgi:L-ascorbate metabolism protein UlaG (beta-lactamase superfamily)